MTWLDKVDPLTHQWVRAVGRVLPFTPVTSAGRAGDVGTGLGAPLVSFLTLLLTLLSLWALTSLILIVGSTTTAPTSVGMRPTSSTAPTSLDCCHLSRKALIDLLDDSCGRHDSRCGLDNASVCQPDAVSQFKYGLVSILIELLFRQG